ncbi:protein-ADP-ribose hydrolase [Paenibacillus alginolyticus]|uniref:Protein-ADP-ribose hydrolase n=1 Tax=Paenibacillus alginolyticus TaxID=59839 RepID=A0ABT4G6N5_9BACL|nr:protein-ADP-ribose hydrolase [Paenibacillus alginolyticus]MCY9691803.1 protein-ADP-ribose hydrolase [Paenibacillus alginolyticus]MEC0143232.1 protein-ADP-ribose hydrolase [Paenibacillus alginolyticus]
MTQLSLKEYASPIHLTDCYEPSLLYLNRKEEMVDELLETFLKEKEELREAKVPRDYAGKRDLLKGILTIREPKPLDVENLNKLDSLLQTELMERGVIEVGPLEPISDIYPNCSFNQSHKFTLWQGDMTRLGADAIVNAANKYLLGCFHPYHACIDNDIHSAAGPQLREDCNTIMSLQGELEDTGGAKITRGYNLPSKFVLHTVGPIIDKGIELTEQQKAELASCYRSCLDLANELVAIKTVAFCAISTGVFGFPKAEAAQIAVRTVNEWLNTNPNHFEKIIFNVFSDEDYNEYLHVLQS